MVDGGVHITIEAVFARIGLVPACRRLLVGKRDPHDRLDRLEAIFPRHHEAQRRAVLVWQHLAIDPGRDHGERVHRLIQPQPLDIGPIEHRRAQAGHFVGAQGGFKGHVFGRGLHAHLVQQRRQLEAVPRDHHRPGLDAAHPIDPFLDVEPLEQIGQIVIAGPLDHAVNLHTPRIGGEAMGMGGRIFLAGAELVVVVIATHLLKRVGLALDRHFRHGRAGNRAKAKPCGAGHDLTPVEIGRFRGHIGPGQFALVAHCMSFLRLSSMS